MVLNKSPLILAGQVYLHQDLDEYLIVTRNNSGLVTYCGIGFKGSSDDFTFLDRFPPVDPEDVCPIELQCLLCLCPDGTTPKIGFIMDDESEEDEIEEV